MERDRGQRIPEGVFGFSVTPQNPGKAIPVGNIFLGPFRNEMDRSPCY